MADREVGGLVIAIRATAEDLERTVEDAKERLRGIGTAADQTRKPLKDAGIAGKDAGRDIASGAKEGQFALLALAAVAVFAFREISGAVKQGVQDANAYKDALRGLNSVAVSTGIASAAMEKATEKVVDQFFNATAAATAFKNLLLRGYSLDQATATIIRLKDAAAFGRQASLSLSQAVVSATEGLKNENSILVDNAGVTKNVAKMWEEYAKSIGVAVANLTQAQKIEAEYQGIRRETAAMTGDILKLQDSLSGKMAAAENQAYLLSVAYGEAMTPLQAAGTELKTGFLEVLTGIVETLPGVASGATAATASILAMGVAVGALSKGKKIIDSIRIALTALNVSAGTLGWIAAAVGLAVGIFTGIQKYLEKQRADEEARIQSNREAVKAQQERTASLRETLNAYVELSKKQSLSYTEAFELKRIEAELAAQYGITREELDKLAASTDNYAEALNGAVIAATGAQAFAALEQQAADSLAAAQKQMANLENLSKYSIVHPTTGERFTLAGLSISADDFKAQSEAAFADINQWIEDELAVFKETVEQQGGEFNDDISRILTAALIPNVDLLSFDSADSLLAFFEGLIGEVGTIAANAASSDALDELQSFSDLLMAGVMPSDEQILEAMEAWSDLLGVDGKIYQYMQGLVDAGVITAEQFDATMASLAQAADPLSVLGAGFDDTKVRAENFMLAVEDAEGTVASAKKEIEDLAAEQKKLSAELEKTRGWSTLYKQWKDLNAAGKDTSAVYKQMQGYFKAFDRSVDNNSASIGAFNDHIEWTSANAQARLSEITNRGYELNAILIAIENNSSIDAEIRADASQAKSELWSLLELLFATVSAFEQLGEVETGGSGGGGGHSAAPTPNYSGPSESAYEKAISAMEHLKALDQLTYEQELENLEDIARRIRMSKDEQLDLEERIYDAKKRIAERDAQNLTDLTDAIISALEARYAKMREAELDALDQSRDAWEEWRDHNVSAIQEQIDALDALEEAENRQQTKEEHLRKIARIEQSLAYEQDEYNRLQLQKQLDAARKAYENWQRSVDREDQRADLRNQIDDINTTADTEIEALNNRRQEIEDFYKDRMSLANLQAEAEIELMKSTQQQIIDLLAEYAPEYDAIGRTLGERMMDGFLALVGNFDDWFDTFSANLASVMDQMHNANVAAANNRTQETGNSVNAREVTITQQNTFNTPVESPADTARRIQRANEDLAEQIMTGG